jgi:mono/diheme cytochrome c family protein
MRGRTAGANCWTCPGTAHEAENLPSGRVAKRAAGKGCGSQSATITVSGVVFDEAQIAAGAAPVYAQYCASCHGANAKGSSRDFPLLPDETGRFGAPPHNGYGHTSHHPDDWLIAYVRDGGISLCNPALYYPMPAFGDQLSDQEIARIIAYIKTKYGMSVLEKGGMALIWRN